MRLKRLSFIAGWAAVALLALAGFAAFGTPESTVDELESEAAAASLGHNAGAQAGLAFAVLAGNPAEVALATTEPADTEEPATADQGSNGSIAADTPGWLSQVQVRALVSLYFEPEDVNRAVRVAWCESRFDPESTNLRTGAVGLFQHLPQYWAERAAASGFAGADPTDPQASTAAAAWAVYNGGGWDIFACRG